MRMKLPICIISNHEKKSLSLRDMLISENWQSQALKGSGLSAAGIREASPAPAPGKTHRSFQQVPSSESLMSSRARPHYDVRRASWEGHIRCRSRCHSGRWQCPPGQHAAGWRELHNLLPWHNHQTAWNRQ